MSQRWSRDRQRSTTSFLNRRQRQPRGRFVRKVTLQCLCIVLAGSTSAFAEEPTPGGQPRLEFHTIPLEGMPNAEHKVTPYRLQDKMIVTVRDPIACGQKPVDPTFLIEGNSLSLTYALTSAAADAKRCTLVSEFDIFNAPHRDFNVRFAGGAEPYTVATMKKCPFYTPSSNDIWECLAPERQ
jgi:hypothetical protein